MNSNLFKAINMSTVLLCLYSTLYFRTSLATNSFKTSLKLLKMLTNLALRPAFFLNIRDLATYRYRFTCMCAWVSLCALNFSSFTATPLTFIRRIIPWSGQTCTNPQEKWGERVNNPGHERHSSSNCLSVIPVYSSCCSARLILRCTRRALSEICWRGRGICSDVPVNQSRKKEVVIYLNYRCVYILFRNSVSFVLFVFVYFYVFPWQCSM